MNLEEKNRLINAVKTWCLCRGFEEMENQNLTADLVFKNGEKSVGFIILDEQTGSSIPLKTGCDLTYAVISDNRNRGAVQKRIPAAWGILCYGDPFGLGCLYQLFREAK
ncbi:MAG: hypothetical protein J5852_01220 [Clostridia bacterium]|nr:hypothetical protein [Clostridia bacterium]